MSQAKPLILLPCEPFNRSVPLNGSTCAAVERYAVTHELPDRRVETGGVC